MAKQSLKKPASAKKLQNGDFSPIKTGLVVAALASVSLVILALLASFS